MSIVTTSLLLIVVLLTLDIAEAFVIIRASQPQKHQKIQQKRHGVKNSSTRIFASQEVSVETYQHKRWKLTYLYKEAAPGRENDCPIILVHPVGIGLSSWFYEKLMKDFDDNPPIYAPDLIGCGLVHGADPWIPEEEGLFFPLSWVEGVETLMNNVIRSKQSDNKSFFDDIMGKQTPKGSIVLAQGGLAPVGVMLAARNLAVSSLILTSPPIYKDMITEVPSENLKQNYDFLRSPILGNLAFNILESRALIKFFSNLFLFQGECDDDWLDETMKESKDKFARTPVQAFNAGLLQHRSFEKELSQIVQPTLIVSGTGDKRTVDRKPYRQVIEKCELKTVGGVNVLPYENREEIISILKSVGESLEE